MSLYRLYTYFYFSRTFGDILLKDPALIAKCLEEFHNTSDDAKMILAHDDTLEPYILSILRNLQFTTAEHMYTLMATTPEATYAFIRLKSLRTDAPFETKDYTRVYKISYKEKYVEADSVTDEDVFRTILLSAHAQLDEITSLTAEEQLKNKAKAETLSMIVNDQKNLRNNEAFEITINRSTNVLTPAAILNSKVVYEASAIGKINLPNVNKNNYKDISCIKKRWLKLKFCPPITSTFVNSRKKLFFIGNNAF